MIAWILRKPFPELTKSLTRWSSEYDIGTLCRAFQPFLDRPGINISAWMVCRKSCCSHSISLYSRYRLEPTRLGKAKTEPSCAREQIDVCQRASGHGRSLGSRYDKTGQPRGCARPVRLPRALL